MFKVDVEYESLKYDNILLIPLALNAIEICTNSAIGIFSGLLMFYPILNTQWIKTFVFYILQSENLLEY